MKRLLAVLLGLSLMMAMIGTVSLAETRTEPDASAYTGLVENATIDAYVWLDYSAGIDAGFGVGMGCMEATCGALVSAEILMGLEEYKGTPVLRNAREMHQKFTEKCGASICKDLKGRDTGSVICECDDCVRCAVELAEKLYGGN